MVEGKGDIRVGRPGTYIIWCGLGLGCRLVRVRLGVQVEVRNLSFDQDEACVGRFLISCQRKMVTVAAEGLG